MSVWKILGRKGLILAHEPEQYVFGSDRLRTILKGFITREKNNAAGPFCVAFEHKEGKYANFRFSTYFDYIESGVRSCNLVFE